MKNVLKPYEFSPKGNYLANWIGYFVFLLTWPTTAIRILREFWKEAKAKAGIVGAVIGWVLMAFAVLALFAFYTVTGPVAALLNFRPSLGKPN